MGQIIGFLLLLIGFHGLQIIVMAAK